MTTIPLTGIRKIIAERLSKSHLTAPPVTLIREINASNLRNLREELLKRVTTVRISYTHLLIKACAEAIRDYPIINSRLEGDQIKILEQMNFGVAVANDTGLIVPVIREVGKMTLMEIASEFDRLLLKAQKGTLTIPELTGGTFTITNLGMFEIDAFTPIINPPESAILGVGRMMEKPVALNGKIEIAPLITLSLTFDHRVMDGAMAAKFLKSLTQIIENPEEKDYFNSTYSG